MSWEAVAGISAAITVLLVVAGIIFSGGRLSASVDQLGVTLARLGRDVTGLRHDLQEQARLASSLERTITALDSRVGHMERVVEDQLGARAAEMASPPKRSTKPRPLRPNKRSR